MKVLIKDGLVIDPKNKRHSQLDILLDDGIITKIKSNITDKYDYLVDAKDYIVSPAFVDLHTNFCDPGVTVREDLKSGSLSAIKGGYGFVVLGTDNKPAPSECNVIDYIMRYREIMPLSIFPCGAITESKKGEKLADLQFLFNHGVVGFFDGLRPIVDKELLKEALKKVKELGCPLAIYSGNLDGVKVRGINDGKVAQKLGIKNAEKSEDEATDLYENIKVLKDIGATIDFCYITTKESIELINITKKNLDNVYAEVPALNLILTEKALEKSGTLAKVVPSLKTESDRKALVEALKNGDIDIIASNHAPCTEAEKEEKLKNATNGAIGLETTLGICGKVLVATKILTWDEVIEKIAVNPAKLYQLEEYGAGSIQEGDYANLTIFDPNEKWALQEEDIASKSHNTPLIDVQLLGKVKYTICDGKLVYRDIPKSEETEEVNDTKKSK